MFANEPSAFHLQHSFTIKCKKLDFPQILQLYSFSPQIYRNSNKAIQQIDKNAHLLRINKYSSFLEQLN